jgi:hypothetical protein
MNKRVRRADSQVERVDDRARRGAWSGRVDDRWKLVPELAERR